VNAGTRELLVWLGDGPRPYPEAIDVWRTTCPQHSLWEDALGEKLIEVVRNGSDSQVVITPRGRDALAAESERTEPRSTSAFRRA
jgi:hypothetical protein